MADKMLRPVVWVAGSRADLAALPKAVKASFGIRLDALQRGKDAHDVKALPQIGAGVFEMRDSFDKNAYRMMYVLKLKKAIYVLHVFMKKSKSGIGLPKPDLATITARLKRAREMDAEN